MKTIEKVGVIGIYFGFYVIGTNLLVALTMMIFPQFEKYIILQIIIDTITLVAIMMMCKKLIIEGIERIKLSSIIDIFKYYAIMIIARILASIPVVFIATELTSTNQESVNIMLQTNTLYTLYATIIFAPFVEELVFRGVIYKQIRDKMGVLAGTIISSLIFALMHFIISIANNDMSDLIFLPVYMAPAIVFCMAYEKTNNIFISILIHLISNLNGILTMFFY